MKKCSPKVSIGVAVYNGEKYLEETLDSVLSQTYSDLEVIISDNASTDRTAEICRRYVEQDERVRYYRNAANLGVAPNYNRVFVLSTGEYFKWADYDDVLEPEFLARCVEVLDQNPDVVICYPRVKIIDEHGVVVDQHDPGPDTSSAKPQERFRNLILYPELAIQSMGLIRSSTIRKTALHGSFPSSDEIFLAELAMNGKYYEIQDRLLQVRLHPEQSTRGAQTLGRDRVIFFDTSLEGKIVLPTWSYLFGCLTAINRAPMSRSAKIQCSVQMVRWVLVPAHFRALGKDILLAVRKLFLRRSRTPQTKTQQVT